MFFYVNIPTLETKLRNITEPAIKCDLNSCASLRTYTHISIFLETHSSLLKKTDWSRSQECDFFTNMHVDLV